MQTYVETIETEGYLYCMYNEMYEYYGEHVYKLGETKEFKNRQCGYTTSYVKPLELKFISKKLRNKTVGEKILFYLLKNYRLVKNREFFKCELSIIRTKFTEVEDIFNKYTDKDIYEKYSEIFKNIDPKLKFNLDNATENNDDIFEEIIKNNDKINKMYPVNIHIIDIIKTRIDILECKDKNIILNDDKFEKELCIQLLNMNKDKYNLKKIQINKYECLFITKILRKIDVLYEIEDILEIKRYAVNDIYDKKLNIYTKKLLDINDKLYIFGNDTHSKKKNISIMNKRIDKIERIDQLQKLITDFYNTLGDIIKFNKKISKNITHYYDFVII